MTFHEYFCNYVNQAKKSGDRKSIAVNATWDIVGKCRHECLLFVLFSPFYSYIALCSLFGSSWYRCTLAASTKMQRVQGAMFSRSNRLKGKQEHYKGTCSHKCKITNNATIMFVLPLKTYVHVLCTHISTIGKQYFSVNIVVRLRMQIWACLSLWCSGCFGNTEEKGPPFL